MKQSKPKNNFSQETRLLFQEAWQCWWCGMNTADSLHHIVSRGGKDSTTESSTLNACPLCNQKCHLPNHGVLKTEAQIKIMLNKTYDYLIGIGYKLTELDIEFMEQYIDYYQ